MPTAGVAGQGERGEHGDERGAQRRREEGTAVTAATPSSPAASVSAGSGGERSARRARRREGYPPEGPRPRSGLGRVARSRSDAPRLTDPSGTAFTIFGTIGGTDRIATGTVVVGSGGKLATITGCIMVSTGVRTIAGIVGGADGTMSSRQATR